jgi:hypothetical protein
MDAPSCTAHANMPEELPHGPTLLHALAARDDILGVRRALDVRAADVVAQLHTRNSADETPMHLARSEDVVTAFFQAGADLDARNCSGAAPLHIAAHLDRQNVVKALLMYGARVTSCADSGRTPLHVARSLKIARALLAAGADVDAVSSDGIRAGNAHFAAMALVPHTAESARFARFLAAAGINVDDV